MKKIQKIQTLVDNICSGNFSNSDVEVLFIQLREDFFDTPILLDLSNFVAHGDERDRGLSFEYVKSYVMNFIAISEKGGAIFGGRPVFQSISVVNELIRKLEILNIIFDKNKFLSQKDKIISSLQDLMDETDFKFIDPRIIRCYLRKVNNRVMFCMKLDLKGPVIKTSPDAIISSYLFN